MPLPPFPDLTDAKVFPAAESSWLEFKQDFTCQFDKIKNTICALLNSGGGYIVFGVADKSNNINGIKRGEHDMFCLKMDDAYKNNHIFFDTGETMALDTITITMVIADGGKKNLTVVTCRPEEGRVYRLKNGEIWHRLSASNFRQTVPMKIYTEDNLEDMKKKYKKILKIQSSESDKLLGRVRQLEGIVEQLQKEIEVTEASLGVAKENLADAKSSLEMIVAAHKNSVEKISAQSLPSLWSPWSLLLSCFCL